MKGFFVVLPTYTQMRKNFVAKFFNKLIIRTTKRVRIRQDVEIVTIWRNISLWLKKRKI